MEEVYNIDDTTKSGAKLLASAPRFPKDSFVVKVEENAVPGSVIVKVPMVNTTGSIVCTILNGNGDGIFSTTINEDWTYCKIMTQFDLDYESESQYNLTLVLHPVGMDVTQDSSSILSKAFVS